MNSRDRFIPYPQIEKLAVIGDRRTAALIAADETIDCCVALATIARRSSIEREFFRRSLCKPLGTVPEEVGPSSCIFLGTVHCCSHTSNTFGL